MYHHDWSNNVLTHNIEAWTSQWADEQLRKLVQNLWR
jgi:hypothetical protein